MNRTAARILVISPNWIGDAIMAQPLLQLLKQQDAAVLVDVLAPAWVAPVWEAMLEVNQVYATQFRHGKLQLGERWRLARSLREVSYDRAYVLPNTLKFALIPWMAGIPKRIGYLGEKRYGLLNVIHHDNKDSPRPMIPFYAALASPPSGTVQGREAYPVPHMVVEKEKAERVLEKLGMDTGKRIVAFAPGAEFGPAKRWPVHGFASLARRILADFDDVIIVLLGSPNDRPVCDEIAAQALGVSNLAGKTTLAEAIALISQIDAMVTNDSGLMHVASAFEKPVIAIYGSTDYHHTPPFSKYSEIVSLDLPCAPCQKRECPLGHHDCMEKLGPDSVYRALKKYLADPVAIDRKQNRQMAGNERGKP